jgi:hypothetical protein
MTRPDTAAFIGQKSSEGHEDERREDREAEHDALTALVAQRSDETFHMTSR